MNDAKSTKFGNIESISNKAISGWYQNIKTEDLSSIIAIIDETHTLKVTASQRRPDVKNAGFPKENSGFVLQLPSTLTDMRKVEIYDADDNTSIWVVDMKERRALNSLLIGELPPSMPKDDDTRTLKPASSPQDMTVSILEHSEPFIDFEMQSIRKRFAKEHLTDHIYNLARCELGEYAQENLVRLIGDMMLDIHILKCAHLEQQRYVAPEFTSPMPSLHKKERPNSVEIDMRGDITGGNWWEPESDGRWAGPDSESTVYFPKVTLGKYEMKIHIVGEIEPDIIDSMQLFINKQELEFTRTASDPSCTLIAIFEIGEESRLPFNVIKFVFQKLRSPAEFGHDDTRRIAIRVKSVTISKALG